MEAKENDLELFDEKESLKVIREMIQVSRKKIKSDGIIFILWGWVMFFGGIIGYITREFVLTYQFQRTLSLVDKILVFIPLVYTIYYLWKQHRMVQTYIGISLRYVWISMFVCLVLINLIQYNVLHQINFELQYSIFMVVTAFSIVITGGILRYNFLIVGGTIFGLIALCSSYLPLPNQMLLSAFGWLIAFVIPGHYLYAKRKN